MLVFPVTAAAGDSDDLEGSKDEPCEGDTFVTVFVALTAEGADGGDDGTPRFFELSSPDLPLLLLIST